MGLHSLVRVGLSVLRIVDLVWDMSRLSLRGLSRGQGIRILLVSQLKYRLLVGSIQLVPALVAMY